ncbi:MAG TPA: universal stress protein [Kofleriaceae bacterium]|nr:universal stress protein [Kofleriaceae bacterium]
MAIVCGTDLSEESLNGLAAALAIAARRGDRDLVLVNVIDPDTIGDSEAARDVVAESARRRIDADAARLAQGSPTRVRGEVLLGPPVASLIATTETEGGDLLVITSQGVGKSEARTLGSTAAALVAAASVPVLVVRDSAPFIAWAAGDRPLKVLIGLDDSASCVPAIALLKTLRAAGPVDVVVGHVYYADEAARRYGVKVQSLVDADPELERLIVRDLERQLGPLPGDGALTVKARPGLGRIGDHLLELADAEQVDVLVVGTRQKGGLGRLSSVSSLVLWDAKQAVWCVPARATIGKLDVPRFRVAAVATDLSDFGNQAVPYAYTMLGERGGEVHLVHIRDEDHEGVDEATLHRRLQALVPPGQTGVISKTHVVTGDDAAQSIGETAERLGADVVVLASRGRTGITRALLGSVADKVLRSCRRPVLILRPPTE